MRVSHLKLIFSYETTKKKSIKLKEIKFNTKIKFKKTKGINYLIAKI
jgi:hypothetical protein